MQNIKKQDLIIAKNSVILFSRLIFTTIIGIISTNLIVKNLGIKDYGLYNVVGSIVFMINFLNLVLISSTYRFITYELGRESEENVNKVFNICLTLHSIVAILLFLFAALFGIWYINNYLNIEQEKINDAKFVFYLSVLSTSINIFSIPFQGLLTALEKFNTKSLIEVLRSVLQLISLVFLSYFNGNKLRIYSFMILILTILISSMFIFYCFYHYPNYTKLKLQKDKSKYKEIIEYSGWTMIGALASLAKDSGLPIIINYFFGTILNASFGIANQLNRFLNLFTQSINQAAIPQIIKSYSSGAQNRTINLSAYTTKYSFFLSLIPSLPILLETKFLLKLWIGQVPAYTIIFCKLIIIYNLLETLRTGIIPIIQASGKIKWFQLSLSIVLLMGLPICYILFKLNFESYYSLFVYILISVFNLILTLILIKKIINIDIKEYILQALIKPLIVIIFLIPLFFIISIFNENFLRFLFSSITSIIYYFVILYIFGLDHKEKFILIENLKKNIFKK